MIILGITGSIGMGKTTAGSMLEYLGVPVHDADVSVHELLKFDSKAWPALAATFPYFSYPQIYGRRHAWNPFKETERFLKREALGKIVFEDEQEREKLESILHPFVRQDQDEFIKQQRSLGKKTVALDIPLLFETGADQRVDYTINISAPSFIQRARVMARPGMSDEKLDAILQRQMPDGEKSARADFVVHSGLGRAHMMKELKQLLYTITDEQTEDEPLSEAL